MAPERSSGPGQPQGGERDTGDVGLRPEGLCWQPVCVCVTSRGDAASLPRAELWFLQTRGRGRGERLQHHACVPSKTRPVLGLAPRVCPFAPRPESRRFGSVATALEEPCGTGQVRETAGSGASSPRGAVVMLPS